MIKLEIMRGRFDPEKICDEIHEKKKYFGTVYCRVDITFDLPPAKGAVETRIPSSKVVRDEINRIKDEDGFATTDAFLRHCIRLHKIYRSEAGVLFIKSERKRKERSD